MLRYAPGPGLLVTQAGCVVLVDDSADATELLAALDAPSPVGAVLDLLTRTGLSSAPSFVLLHGSTLLVRGSAVASLSNEVKQVRTLDADGATTWREHRLADGDRVVALLLGEAEDRWLPLSGGAVLAGAVAFDGEPVPRRGRPEKEAAAAAVVPPPVGVPVVEAPVVEAPVVVAPPAAPLVDAVPLVSAVPFAAATEPASGGAVTPSESTLVEVPPGDYDHLFGHTVVRSVEEAAVRPAAEQSVPVVADTDHDGHTVMASDLLARRKAASTAGLVDDVPRVTTSGPTVLAVRCPEGHVNRPGTGECRSCGATVVQEVPLAVPRPSLGRVSVPGSPTVELDRSVLVGRAPAVQRVSVNDLPHLLTVPSPQKEVSSTHVELRVEGWDLLAVDLSSNGTVLTRPGQEPQRLRKSEPTLVLPGCSFDLGDGVVVVIEPTE